MAPSHSTSKRKAVLPLHIDTASFLNPPPSQHNSSTLSTLVQHLTTWRRGGGGGGGTHKRQVVVLLFLLLLMSVGWNIRQYQARWRRYDSFHSSQSNSGNNDPLPSAPLTHHHHAIVITGHAMYTGPTQTPTYLEDEDHWILEPYQRGQVTTYLNHIQKGIELLLADPQALLIFSGGQTRISAGPISEGTSYWQIAQMLLKQQQLEAEDMDKVRKRMIVEDYARDSYENVLFSLCRFAEMTSTYPTRLTVIGFEFKRARFEQLHLQAIRYPLDQFNYIGIDPEDDHQKATDNNNNNDTGDAAAAAAAAVVRQQGERMNSYIPFLADLYGCHGSLRQKKLDRNPYRRRSPYRSTCPILAPLLDYCPSNNSVFHGPLPWSS